MVFVSFLAAGLAFGPLVAHGFPQAPSQPTMTVTPTLKQMPERAVTPAPELAYMPNLDARDVGSDTCGYDKGFTYTCAPGYTCTNSGSNRECCFSNDCSTSTFDTKCWDSVSCPTTSSASDHFICCRSSAYPWCITYLWTTTASPNQFFTFYGCSAYGPNTAVSILAATPLVSSTTSTSTTSTSSSSTSSSSSTTTTLPPTPGPTDGGSGGPPVGPIVGGVVGGVAVLALIGLALFFILRKKAPKQSAQPAEINAAMTQPPPPPPAFGGPQPMPNSGGYPSPPIGAGVMAPMPPQSPDPFNTPPGHQHTWSLTSTAVDPRFSRGLTASPVSEPHTPVALMPVHQEHPDHQKAQYGGYAAELSTEPGDHPPVEMPTFETQGSHSPHSPHSPHVPGPQ